MKYDNGHGIQVWHSEPSRPGHAPAYMVNYAGTGLAVDDAIIDALLVARDNQGEHDNGHGIRIKPSDERDGTYWVNYHGTLMLVNDEIIDALIGFRKMKQQNTTETLTLIRDSWPSV